MNYKIDGRSLPRTGTEYYSQLKKLMPLYYDAWLARKFGKSKERIRQLRNKWGIVREMPKQICTINSFTEAELGMIIEGVKNNKPTTLIAKELKRSMFSIRSVMSRHGMRVSKYHLPRACKVKNPRKLNKARKLYRQGISLYRIAKECNVSARTPYIWKKAGWLDSDKMTYNSRGVRVR